MEKSDDVLMKAAASGDETAFVALYRRHLGSARHDARQRCPRTADADDAVAAAFVAVFRVMMSGRSIRHFHGYLRTAVRNAVIDQARRTRLELVPLDGVDVADHMREDADEPAVGDLMAAALQSLPARQREALWRSEVEGVDSADLARSMQLSDNAFAALKARAKRNLSAALLREKARAVSTPGESFAGVMAA